MTPRQFFSFLSPNERGTFLNSTDGNVQYIRGIGQFSRFIDLNDPQIQAGLLVFMSADRIAALQSQPIAVIRTPTITDAQAAGFTPDQITFLLNVYNAARI